MNTINNPYFVTFYDVELCYGGPEEGGWWYDWYTPYQTQVVDEDGEYVVDDRTEEPEFELFPPIACETEDDAYELARFLNEWANEVRIEAGEPSYSSVLGGYQVVASVERIPYSNRSTQRPHYE